MTCPVCGKDHHGLCHKCPHSDDVQAGKWAKTPFEKAPCNGCREHIGVHPADESCRRHAGGHSFFTESGSDEIVSIEELHNLLDGNEPETQQGTTVLDAAVHFIRVIINMSTVDREIVIRRVLRDDYQLIAKHLTFSMRKKFSVQAVHARVMGIIKENRQMAWMLVGTVEKQKRNNKRKGES